MPDESLIEKTKARLREHRFTTLSDKPASGLYLFFSFDLVNSTQFKASNPQRWPLVVTRFYELVNAELSTRITSAIPWKYVGDEVLFYKRVTGRADIHKALPAAYGALNAAIDLLHKGYPETKGLLSIKATAWLAIAEFIQPTDIENAQLTSRNIIVPTGRSPDSFDRDFLGPDIDAGFRISKFALRKRLVVSAQLAWLLYRERANCEGIEQKLRIVGFESLKGVWGGRHYPIIWFEDNWPDVPGSFLYDEHLSSEIVRELRRSLETAQTLATVPKIFSDLEKEDEVNDLLRSLHSLAPIPDEDRVEIEIPREKFSEVHCVAVCFRQDGKVLIGKRPVTKKRLPGAFEFGCGQLKLGDTFADALRRAYKDDFGIALNIPENPIPIRTFLIEDKEERRKIPGIIFIAEIQNPDVVEDHYSREKHSEISWIDPVNFAPSPGASYVPDFLDTLKEACAARIELG